MPESVALIIKGHSFPMEESVLRVCWDASLTSPALSILLCTACCTIQATKKPEQHAVRIKKKKKTTNIYNILKPVKQ